jgi:hypothetical protein
VRRRTTVDENKGRYNRYAKAAAERLATGDPQPSIEERYPSFGQCCSVVDNAIAKPAKDRLVLREDADDAQARLLDAALAAGVHVP